MGQTGYGKSRGLYFSCGLDGACSMYGGEDVYRVVVGKPEGN